ncbi:MAG: GntR family transcriptional regulator [Deltaproteobacteria bacterium]|nr:GntR family transcriptional regulator [Deltaproteobacteria bacterium]
MSENAEQIAYSRIKTAIYKQYIRQGSRLAEASLAKQLNLSRTPVRHALRRLHFDGLVEFSPNGRAQIICPTENIIRQTYAVRAQLEKMAAALAAQNATKKDVAELKVLVAEEMPIYKKFIASGLRRGLSEYHEVNEAFHARIAKLSGNEVLYEQIFGLLQKCRIYLILFDTYDQMDFNPSLMASPMEHEEIILRLSKGDSQGAEEAMMNHLNSTLDGMDFDISLPDDHMTI